VATSAEIWSQVIQITREQFAAADIAAMPSRPAARNNSDTDGSETAIARDSGDTPAVGEGPNGEPLYNAEWYRRPTRAELGFYLASAAPQTGWGMIVCQTVTDYRVDNCHEIGQSPEGSGLAPRRSAAASSLCRSSKRMGSHG
jgi:protein TonB